MQLRYTWDIIKLSLHIKLYVEHKYINQQNEEIYVLWLFTCAHV